MQQINCISNGTLSTPAPMCKRMVLCAYYFMSTIWYFIYLCLSVSVSIVRLFICTSADCLCRLEYWLWYHAIYFVYFLKSSLVEPHAKMNEQKLGKNWNEVHMTFIRSILCFSVASVYVIASSTRFMSNKLLHKIRLKITITIDIEQKLKKTIEQTVWGLHRRMGKKIILRTTHT